MPEVLACAIFIAALASPVLAILLLITRSNAKRQNETTLSEAREKINTINESKASLRIEHESAIAAIRADSIAAVRDIWIAELDSYKYRNEVEVEAQFIYPLVRFLGYGANELQIRRKINVQVGRNDAIGHADWVLLKDKSPHIVIEAKAASESINDAVQLQARSYAFALNAPIYVLTNGVRFVVYQRGVQRDEMVLDVLTPDLSEHWQKISTLLT